MDITVIGVIAGNVVGWIVVVVGAAKKYGQLTQQVKDLDDTINNGMSEQMAGISRHVANIEGRLQGLKIN